MLVLRKGSERGYFEHGWLRTHHTFSFGEYQDPKFMRFGPLRVINEDVIEPAAGFPMHSHRDMEILTYVLRGEVEHLDSMGNREKIRAGEIQKMSAGRGVRHSESNPSPTDELHLYQIWVLPSQTGIDPGYEKLTVLPEWKTRSLYKVASPYPSQGAIRLVQAMEIYIGVWKKGDTASMGLERGEALWVQVIYGRVTIGELHLGGSDGLACASEDGLKMCFVEDTEILVFRFPDREERSRETIFSA